MRGIDIVFTIVLFGLVGHYVAGHLKTPVSDNCGVKNESKPTGFRVLPHTG